MKTMPMFPLPMVVVPGEIVALHIFEPRYRAMIASCRDDEERGGPGEFLITAFVDGRPLSLGTAVTVHQILKTYPDGRHDLLALGRRRCNVVAIEPGAVGYGTAIVEDVPDESSDWDETVANRVFGLHRQLVTAATGDEPPAEEYAGLASLSFHIAPTAGLELAEKQHLLGLRSESQRLEFLVDRLKANLEAVTLAQRIVGSVHNAWQTTRVAKSV